MSHLIEKLDRDDQASLDSLEEVGKLWWEKQDSKTPDNLRKRVETAAILCNQDLPTDSRIGIVETIRFALETIPSFEVDQKRLDLHLDGFTKGKINLFDVLQFELDQIEAQNLTENAEIIATIQRLNNTIYRQVKGALKGDFQADALSALDKAIDETKKAKLENPVNTVLAKIQEILSMISRFKNVRLLHFDPDPDNEEIVAINYPLKKRAKKVKKNPYEDVEWERYEDEKGELEVDFKKFPTKTGMKIVYKLDFGDEEFGYIEYEFEEEDIHDLVKYKCSSISAMMDTFLNDRLKEDIKKLIDKKKREIQKSKKPHNWREVFTELSEYLSRVIERPFVITCDRKPSLDENPLVVEVNGAKAEVLDHISDSEIHGESFKIYYESEEGVVEVGELIFDPLDENRESIIQEAVSFFEGIVQWRENQRDGYVPSIGLLASDLKIADNLEEEPTEHPVVVLYADIDDYSNIMTETAVANPNIKNPLYKIVSRFYADGRRVIEQSFNVVVDKFVGDEIIIHVGSPFTKDGVDAFGNTEPDYVKYVELCYEVYERVQKLLDDLTEEIREALNVEPARPLRFAAGAGIIDGDPVGVFGDLNTKGAGADYTIIGPQMNLVSRALSNADGDEFIMDERTFKQYKEAGGTKLEAIGEPYEVPAKGAPNNRAMVVKIRKK